MMVDVEEQFVSSNLSAPLLLLWFHRLAGYGTPLSRENNTGSSPVGTATYMQVNQISLWFNLNSK